MNDVQQANIYTAGCKIFDGKWKVAAGGQTKKMAKKAVQMTTSLLAACQKWMTASSLNWKFQITS
jgi:hypothetical protein